MAFGDHVGELTLTLDGEVIEQVPLVALEPLESAGFFARIWDSILMWLAQLFGG